MSSTSPIQAGMTRCTPPSIPTRSPHPTRAMVKDPEDVGDRMASISPNEVTDVVIAPGVSRSITKLQARYYHFRHVVEEHCRIHGSTGIDSMVHGFLVQSLREEYPLLRFVGKTGGSFHVLEEDRACFRIKSSICRVVKKIYTGSASHGAEGGSDRTPSRSRGHKSHGAGGRRDRFIETRSSRKKSVTSTERS